MREGSRGPLSVAITSLGDAAALRGPLAVLAAQTGMGPFEISIPANDRVTAILQELASLLPWGWPVALLVMVPMTFAWALGEFEGCLHVAPPARAAGAGA